MQQDRFVCNTRSSNVWHTLAAELSCCSEFKMSVAFITYGGLQVMLNVFDDLQKRGVKGEILTSTYLSFTDPRALERLRAFDNLSLKIFVASRDRGFHTKGYLFRHLQEGVPGENSWTVLIGSSNLTDAALKSNAEWNLLHSDGGAAEESAEFSQNVLDEFGRLWNSEYTKDCSEEFLKAYREYRKAQFEDAKSRGIFEYNAQIIEPNRMQDEAIAKLDRLRKSGQTRALAIAATGSGKTYMSVFDALQFKPRRLLFVVHRDTILTKARASFDSVLQKTVQGYSSGLFTGYAKDGEKRYVFATRDTLSRHLHEFKRDDFDYIVIDEAHHAVSPAYREILDYFRPKFLLGLTATPERCDSGDVFALFGNNVAVEIRLRQALEYGLVCPFHYFGITDCEGIDYGSLKKRPGESGYLEEAGRLLMQSRRTDYILKKLEFYGHDGEGKWKILGFCASVKHAEFMAQEFCRVKGAGFALALCGDDAGAYKEQKIRELEDDAAPLSAIFTVDLFNEGVDIPSVNTVLMLRPTQSPIIFVQQLGRGLRKHEGKHFLTVLDFIGNYQSSYLMAIALNGRSSYDRDSLKVAVKSDFADVPGSTHIIMDRIPKEQILRQLEQERFYSARRLRENYLSFKHVNGGRVPFLCDYLRHDGAYDPLNFTLNKAYKTYFGFVNSQEQLTADDQGFGCSACSTALLQLIHTLLLPSGRPYDLALLKFLIDAEDHAITLQEALLKLEQYLDAPDMQTLRHAAAFLKGNFFDSSEIKAYKAALLEETEGKIRLNAALREFFDGKSPFKAWVEDAVDYGLLRYEQEFSLENCGFPFFKIGHRYSMRDTALLCRSEKKHSSFRGQGLITQIEKHFLIFVDLYKKEGIKDSVNYDDHFLSPSRFHWQSPNATSQQSGTGQKLIGHQRAGIRVHLFVRKYPEVEGVTQKFIYAGRVRVIPESVHGDKPVDMDFALEAPLPQDLYAELTTVVQQQAEPEQ